MPIDPGKRVEVLGVLDLGEGNRPVFGTCKLLGVQLDSLPQNVVAKLSGMSITVKTPDGSKSEWVVATAERHCSLRMITLVDATPQDVFAGCAVYL
jgi:hypothetical protein